ncbi:MAG: 2OG-Fe(II) oxygenase [Gammaproteobacteria bacterium]|nr:2OG-Fe(II) oxygenase [Gammaproteobacteria bacterium]
MTLTHNLEIDGKRLLVADNILQHDYLDGLVRRFYNAPFVKNEVGRPDTAAFPHWAHELDIKELDAQPIWKHTVNFVNNYLGANSFKPYRSYVNYGSFTDPMFSHVDATNHELTCLWYIVPKWHIDWAGETLFFNQQNEIGFACTPKPGRLVVFDSRIMHSGRPPSIVSQFSRFTLAFKMEKVTQ